MKFDRRLKLDAKKIIHMSRQAGHNRGYERYC